MLKKQFYYNPYKKIQPETSEPYTIIYLVRHCQPEYRLEEDLDDKLLPLSVIGIRQAKFLVKNKLLKLAIDRVYASELVRARQTAKIYSEQSGHKIKIDSRLNEIDWKNWYKMKYFNMTDKTRVKRVKGYQTMNKVLSNYQAQSRRLLADYWLKNKNKKIILFCHGNLIRSMVTGILNTDVVGFLSMEIYQSSVTKLVIDRDGYIKINYINSIGHLPHRPTEDLFHFAISQ
ncbi:MAG TPA: histidine phosphatase family protein [bacterium]|nr:histidine phosphatase family protein [bacterium]